MSSEQTHTQVQLLFARALEHQALLGPDGLPADRDGDGPILVAWSDNGAEMTAIDTRQFMALMTIAQHHGRPGTPTDQAHVESFFSHLKGDWPHPTAITDAAALDAELARIRGEYNTVRLHAAIGYVTPMTSITAAGPQSAAPAPPGCAEREHNGSSRIEPASDDRHPQDPRSRPPPGEEGRF